MGLDRLLDLTGILIAAAVFIPIERLLPLRPSQPVFRRHWRNDLIYLLFNGLVVKVGFLVLLGLMLLAVRVVLPEGVSAAIQSQPVWLQAIEVILLADAGFYIAHRTFHAVPALWHFHAIHHSIEELDWLAAHRVHPVDQIATMATSLLPVFALGFSDAALAIYAVAYRWQSLLIHSNTRIGFGPLKWIIASPQFHHWHHANERETHGKNFAGQLSLIDALAGTLSIPKRAPAIYGTDDPVPSRYIQQIIYPIRRITARCRMTMPKIGLGPFSSWRY